MNSLFCCIHFLVISFVSYKEDIVCLISFGKFSAVFPAFTCARDIGNLWSICLGINILSSLLYYGLLKSRIFVTISAIFFGFSFQEILKAINPSSILFTSCWFLYYLGLIKSFAKNHGLPYLIWFQNISSFIYFLSAIVSFKNFCCNFNLDFLCFVGSVGSSVVGSCVGFLSIFYWK